MRDCIRASLSRSFILKGRDIKIIKIKMENEEIKEGEGAEAEAEANAEEKKEEIE